MTEIKRAIVKSYDAAAHKATVQIGGSLAVWLDDVRVATDIPAGELIAGRQCSVLFLDPSNQDDAVVLTVHGAAPAGPGGGLQNRITDADNDTRVETEQAADEDKVRVTIAGVERGLFQTTSPHHTITGDQRVTGHIGVGASGSILTQAMLAAIERLNRFRRLVIHTIHICEVDTYSAPFLKRLAESSGGTYRRFDKP